MTSNEVLGLLRRVLFLDPTAFRDLRDSAHLTLIAAGGLAAAVVIAGLGSWLYSRTVLEGGDFSIARTLLLGSLFTLILFGAGFGVTYVVLTTLFRIAIAPDALFRLLAAGYLPFALGLLVCIPEAGFVFGLLSVIGVFYWSLFALRTALPAASESRLALAVVAGMSLWAVMIPFISGPGNEFVTGVFVYGLIA